MTIQAVPVNRVPEPVAVPVGSSGTIEAQNVCPVADPEIKTISKTDLFATTFLMSLASKIVLQIRYEQGVHTVLLQGKLSAGFHLLCAGVVGGSALGAGFLYQGLEEFHYKWLEKKGYSVGNADDLREVMIHFSKQALTRAVLGFAISFAVVSFISSVPLAFVVSSVAMGCLNVLMEPKNGYILPIPNHLRHA